VKYIQVTPVNAIEPVFLPVPIVKEPPYVVIGMANAPFLARVELVCNDIKEDGQTTFHELQSSVIEHWVDVGVL